MKLHFQSRPEYFQLLWRFAKALDCELGISAQRCEEEYRSAQRDKRCIHSRDHYGREVGLAYWEFVAESSFQSFENLGQRNVFNKTASLQHLFYVPGEGRRVLHELACRLVDQGMNSVRMPARKGGRGPSMRIWNVARFEKKTAVALSKRSGELHPVLAGKATAGDAAAALSGAALHVIANAPHLAQVAVESCVQLIDRACGAGHIRVVFDEKQNPVGLLVWARPLPEELERLWQAREDFQLHASQLNVGGDLALIAYAALNEKAASELVSHLKTELLGGGGLSIFLQRTQSQEGDVVRVSAGEVATFLAWFAGRLKMQSSARAHQSC